MSRNTASKIAIEQILKRSESALTHKEILEGLDGLCDRVTVYRVLDRLINECKVHKIVDTSGVMRFAACQECQKDHQDHQHVHFSCTSCESVTCLDDIKPAVKLPRGFVTEEAIYTFSGLCPKCS